MSAQEIHPDCRCRLHPHAVVGIGLLNQGAFYDAHEALEIAWKQETSQVRDLYRGILQTAVVYFHVERNNFTGAVKVYERCLKWLLPWTPGCQGVLVDRMITDLEAVLKEVRRLGPANLQDFSHGHFKPVRITEPDSVIREEMLCDRCGHVMHGRNCKLVCPNCGNQYDCSDLT